MVVSGAWRAPRIALLAAISLLALTGSSQGASPSTELSEAKSRVAGAETAVASSEARVEAARDRYALTARRAKPPLEAARAAGVEARETRSDLRARQRQARERIASLEAAHRQAVDEHDEQVLSDVGFGLAALVGAGIALAWGRFRASGAVAALTRVDRGRTLALCLGGGLLSIVVGAALSDAGGFAPLLGALLLGLGIVLPAALLLARHSVEVERGRAKPLLRHPRLPAWVPRGAALLLLLLALSGLGAALSADEPSAEPVSERLRGGATALTTGPGARRLADATAEAAAARRAAAEPLAERRAARAALREAVRALRVARSQLVRAEAAERRSARRLAALVEREEREAAREAAQAEREAEELAEVEEEEAAPSGCDPNYSGCVPPYPPDADCDEVGETVTVLGEDPHGLDADGDLVACE